MVENKILSKLNINIKDFNNQMEKILENKLFSFDVKNLLLSMLYKIENAYKDYENVKIEVPSKKKFIENILRIIKEKTLNIFLVKPETAEAEELEKNNLKYMVDKGNGQIICFQNELVILTAILKLDESYNQNIITVYDYIAKPIQDLLAKGKIISNVEVLRDFNGWSWNIVRNEIKDFDYNFIYETLILLNGEKNAYSGSTKLLNIVNKMAIKKYISLNDDLEYIERLKKVIEQKHFRLNLFGDKKEFINTVTEEKKEYTKQIEKIDRLLNNNELLKSEYYARNEKLPNKEKIFSVSYLVDILDKERKDLLTKIDECNRVILPKEFVEQKTKLEEECKFLDSIEEEKEYVTELIKEFLGIVKDRVKDIKEENKNELIKWMYKIRYYRYVPVNENENVKDIKSLKKDFKEVISLIIKTAQKFKIWDTFTEDENLSYEILKEIFDTKIIYLQNINIQCKYEDKILHVEYYDDNVLESSKTINIDSVKIKKKIKLFI